VENRFLNFVVAASSLSSFGEACILPFPRLGEAAAEGVRILGKSVNTAF